MLGWQKSNRQLNSQQRGEAAAAPPQGLAVDEKHLGTIDTDTRHQNIALFPIRVKSIGLIAR